MRNISKSQFTRSLAQWMRVQGMIAANMERDAAGNLPSSALLLYDEEAFERTARELDKIAYLLEGEPGAIDEILNHEIILTIIDKYFPSHSGIIPGVHYSLQEKIDKWEERQSKCAYEIDRSLKESGVKWTA